VLVDTLLGPKKVCSDDAEDDVIVVFIGFRFFVTDTNTLNDEDNNQLGFAARVDHP